MPPVIVDSQLQIDGEHGVRSFALTGECEHNVGHSHHYDHDTVVIQGRVRIVLGDRPDGEVLAELGEGESAVVKAGIVHTVKALTALAVYQCRFKHRDLGGEVSKTYKGNLASYF